MYVPENITWIFSQLKLAPSLKQPAFCASGFLECLFQICSHVTFVFQYYQAQFCQNNAILCFVRRCACVVTESNVLFIRICPINENRVLVVSNMQIKRSRHVKSRTYVKNCQFFFFLEWYNSVSNLVGRRRLLGPSTCSKLSKYIFT